MVHVVQKSVTALFLPPIISIHSSSSVSFPPLSYHYFSFLLLSLPLLPCNPFPLLPYYTPSSPFLLSLPTNPFPLPSSPTLSSHHHSASPSIPSDALQQWDDVEFIGIRDLCVAVAVTVTSKKPKEVSKCIANHLLCYSSASKIE